MMLSYAVKSIKRKKKKKKKWQQAVSWISKLSGNFIQTWSNYYVPYFSLHFIKLSCMWRIRSPQGKRRKRRRRRKKKKKEKKKKKKKKSFNSCQDAQWGRGLSLHVSYWELIFIMVSRAKYQIKRWCTHMLTIELLLWHWITYWRLQSCWFDIAQCCFLQKKEFI